MTGIKIISETSSIAKRYFHTEELLLELESKFIEDYDIKSRDGYIPQSFDEIGNEDLRIWAQEKFREENYEIIVEFEALKAEMLGA